MIFATDRVAVLHWLAQQSACRSYLSVYQKLTSRVFSACGKSAQHLEIWSTT